MGNSFTSADYINAKESFLRWQGNISESVDSYILRQRKAELNELVRKVIENELSDYDRVIVKMRWYQNYTVTEIAEKLGVDRSTVNRHLEKINNTIYDKLKYAIEYRYGKSYTQKAKLIIKNNDAYSSTVKSHEVSDRIRKLRNNQCLSVGDVETLTGIDNARLSEIEKHGNRMTMTELKKLCTFYRCSSDYILFGQ